MLGINTRVRYVNSNSEDVRAEWGTVTEIKSMKFGNDKTEKPYAFVVWDKSTQDNDYYNEDQLSTEPV